MRLLVCLHYKFIPVDKSDSHLWICMSQCLPRLMIFHHSNIFNPPPPPFISLYFIWPLNTQTHRDVNMDPAHYVQGACKQLPFHWHVHSLCSSSRFPMLPLLPGASQRQPQALWTLKGPLSDESLTDSIESYETEGTRDGRRRNTERGMYDHAGAHTCPYVSDTFNAIASSTRWEVWKKETVSVKGVRSASFIHADMWCHWYLPCCIYEPTVSNWLHLIDYYRGLGARGNAIKD